MYVSVNYQDMNWDNHSAISGRFCLSVFYLNELRCQLSRDMSMYVSPCFKELRKHHLRYLF